MIRELILASVRTGVADFLSTLIYVYIIVIFAYVVLGWLLNAGLRIPYSRTSGVVLTFVRDVCEPTLRLFRRFSRIGPLDLSPIFAIIALELLNSVVVQGVIHG
jgi:YggT family protein